MGLLQKYSELKMRKMEVIYEKGRIVEIRNLEGYLEDYCLFSKDIDLIDFKKLIPEITYQ